MLKYDDADKRPFLVIHGSIVVSVSLIEKNSSWNSTDNRREPETTIRRGKNISTTHNARGYLERNNERGERLRRRWKWGGEDGERVNRQGEKGRL